MTATQANLLTPKSLATARPWFAYLVLTFLVVKLAQFAFAFFALHLGITEPRFATGYPLVAWDSLHYLNLTIHGYPPRAPVLSEDMCFFPVFPILARLLTPLVSPSVALLVVANVASFAGFCFFFAWCRRVMDDARAYWACLILLTFPTAMFISAAYTEGLFMTFTASALYFSHSRRPWLAALAAGLGSATRATGLPVAIVICLDILFRTPPSARLKSLPKFAALGLLSISGLIAFTGFITVRYGSPLAYFDAQENFVSSPDSPAKASESIDDLNPANTAATPASVAGTTGPASYPPPMPRLSRFFTTLQTKLTTPGSWNTLIAISGALVSLLLLIPRLDVPRHLLLLPILIFLLGFLPDWFIRLNSCARYFVEALPLFAGIACVLAKPRTLPLRLAMVSIGFVLQALYIVAFTRGEWAG